jgi:hypothetical protein
LGNNFTLKEKKGSEIMKISLTLILLPIILFFYFGYYSDGFLETITECEWDGITLTIED